MSDEKPVDAPPQQSTALVVTPAPVVPDDEVDIEERNLGGRPPHVPTEETRNMVQLMEAAGIPRDDICKCLGVKSKNTLMKHYRQQLDTAKTMLDAEVCGKMIENIRKGDTTMIIWYQKTRMGWKETVAIQVDKLPPVSFNLSFKDPPKRDENGKIIENGSAPG